MSDPDAPDNSEKNGAGVDPEEQDETPTAPVAAETTKQAERGGEVENFSDEETAAEAARLALSPEESTTKIVELPELSTGAVDAAASEAEAQAAVLIEPPEIAQTRVTQRILRPDFIADSSGQFESLRFADSTEASGDISRYGVRHGGEESVLDHAEPGANTGADSERLLSTAVPRQSPRSLPQDFDYDLGVRRRNRGRKLSALLLLTSLAGAFGLAGYAVWLLLGRFLA